MEDQLEAAACTPAPIHREGFNPDAVLPYGCTLEHLSLAMSDFIDFLGYQSTALLKTASTS